MGTRRAAQLLPLHGIDEFVLTSVFNTACPETPQALQADVLELCVQINASHQQLSLPEKAWDVTGALAFEKVVKSLNIIPFDELTSEFFSELNSEMSCNSQSSATPPNSTRRTAHSPIIRDPESQPCVIWQHTRNNSGPNALANKVQNSC